MLALEGIREVEHDPQVRYSGMIVEVEGPDGTRVRQAGSIPRLGEGARPRHRVASQTGQHTDAVLGELGYDAAAVADLGGRGVVR